LPKIIFFERGDIMASRKRTQFKNKFSGMTTTEFVIALPPFLFLILLCFEFSLMSIDRHLLTAATHAAARGVLQEALDPKPAPNGSPQPLAVNPLSSTAFSKTCDAIDPNINDNIKKKAALRMAATAPSVQMFVAMTDYNIDIPVPQELVALGGAPLKIASSWPIAWILTNVKKCEVTQDGVTLTIEYFRHPRTPWAGTALWATYALGQFNKSGGNLLNLELDSMYFGVRASSPALNQAQKDLNQAIGTVAETSNSLTSFADQIKALPAYAVLEKAGVLKNMNPMSEFDAAVGDFQNAAKDVQNASNDVFKEANKFVQDAGTVAGTVLYAIPKLLRVVPMQKTIFLAWPNKGLKRHGEWQDGGINFPLNVYKTDPSTSSEFQTWESWSRGLSESEAELNHEK
jgi:hypothetical protein